MKGSTSDRRRRTAAAATNIIGDMAIEIPIIATLDICPLSCIRKSAITLLFISSYKVCISTASFICYQILEQIVEYVIGKLSSNKRRSDIFYLFIRHRLFFQKYSCYQLLLIDVYHQHYQNKGQFHLDILSLIQKKCYIPLVFCNYYVIIKKCS